MLKLGVNKWLRSLSTTPLLNHYISKLMPSVIRKLIMLTGLTMLRVKMKFIICLQINFKTSITVLLIKRRYGYSFNPLGTGDLKFYQSQGLSTFWGPFLNFIKPVFYLSGSQFSSLFTILQEHMHL